MRASARSKAPPEWFQAKVREVGAQTMAPLRAEAASKMSVLPKVLDAMDEWVGKVAQAAAAGADAKAYLDLCDSVRDDVLPPLGVRLEVRLAAGGMCLSGWVGGWVCLASGQLRACVRACVRAWPYDGAREMRAA